MAKKFYITTAITYASGKPHIGNTYEAIFADAIARFKREQGFDVFFLTGTDEHGLKVEQKAAAKGVTPKSYVDEAAAVIKSIWDKMNVSYDKFIRTTDASHIAAVQKIFNKFYEQGDIYKGSYQGLYCTPCESFWTEAQLVDGKCPDCGREVELTKEESYFFRLSKYQDRIQKLIEDDKEFLQPVTRQNEMLNNFIKPGLQDLCVSRTSFDWGIKVPFDAKHVIYVWIDALTNYITALGYTGDNDELFKKYWPADVHMMGKEIIRFHSIIWPAILMALDLPLPKKVYGHGWLMFNNDKMSKSKGNIVDPFILCERYGVDALRYYMLREVPFGQDGNFTNEIFLKLRNSDLANDLGNLVSRVTAMVSQYFDGVIPAPTDSQEVDRQLIDMAEKMYPTVTSFMDEMRAPEALETIFKVIQRANKYIDECTPWILAKTDEGKERLKTVLYNLCESIRMSAVILQPFLTQTPSKIFAKLGIGEDMGLTGFDSLEKFGAKIDGLKVDKGEQLFQRIDIAKELKVMDDILEEQLKKAKQAEKEEKKVENTVTIEQIGIEDFAKVQLKVGKVLECKKVEKADKLLCSQIDVGEEIPRTVVSGIAKYYTPEEMVGKQVIVVTNLKPAKLRGIESQGMILCAEDENGELALITPSKSVRAGSEVG